MDASAGATPLLGRTRDGSGDGEVGGEGEGARELAGERGGTGGASSLFEIEGFTEAGGLRRAAAAAAVGEMRAVQGTKRGAVQGTKRTAPGLAAASG